jgi:hypothetical protein
MGRYHGHTARWFRGTVSEARSASKAFNMWCGHCHQDVPGVAHAAGGRIVCSQCQRPMAGRQQVPAAPICDDGIELTEHVATRKNAAPPIHTDEWSIRQRARELDRVLRRPMHFGATSGAAAARLGQQRIDPPHDLLDQIARTPPPTITTSAASTPQIRPSRTTAGQIFAWLIVASGAITLFAGIGLIGWSLHENEMQHWNLGLSLALGGQGALIFGLVMVVSRLWRNSRYATNRLQEMHARLGQLQNSADTISAMRGGAPAFYADLARGASPQMLLSNLKGQLDQLATRLGA